MEPEAHWPSHLPVEPRSPQRPDRRHGGRFLGPEAGDRERPLEALEYIEHELETAPQDWERRREPPDAPPPTGGRWGLREGVREVGIPMPGRHRGQWNYELGNYGRGGDVERRGLPEVEYAEPWSGEFGPAARVSGFEGHPFAAPPRRGFRGVGPRSYQRLDERLRDEAWERLANDPDLDASRLTLEVEDGEVALRGAVDDPRDRAVAEEICAEIHGVRGVYNRIRVEGVRPGWDEIRRASLATRRSRPAATR
jgi:hypothetical protein